MSAHVYLENLKEGDPVVVYDDQSGTIHTLQGWTVGKIFQEFSTKKKKQPQHGYKGVLYVNRIKQQMVLNRLQSRGPQNRRPLRSTKNHRRTRTAAAQSAPTSTGLGREKGLFLRCHWTFSGWMARPAYGLYCARQPTVSLQNTYQGHHF